MYLLNMLLYIDHCMKIKLRSVILINLIFWFQLLSPGTSLCYYSSVLILIFCKRNFTSIFGTLLQLKMFFLGSHGYLPCHIYFIFTISFTNWKISVNVVAAVLQYQALCAAVCISKIFCKALAILGAVLMFYVWQLIVPWDKWSRSCSISLL